MSEDEGTQLSLTTLPELPIEVLETICSSLDLQTRIALTSCCLALRARSDVAASSGLWGELDVRGVHTWRPKHRQSLTSWLAARRGGLRSLRLGLEPKPRADLGPLLAALAGSGLTQLTLPHYHADEEERLNARWGALAHLRALRALVGGRKDRV